MASENHSSSLRCEVRIIKANINIKSRGVVFVRCYLSAGIKSKVRIESQEIPSKSNAISINQTFSLDCLGSSSSIKWLKQETLVFELRWRSKAAPFIGRIQGSKLIGRAEVPWKDVLDSTNMEVQKWLVMVPQNLRVYHDDAIKPIALQVGLKIQDFYKRVERNKVWDERCGCMDAGCNSCLEYEFFALEAALEALYVSFYLFLGISLALNKEELINI